MAAIIKMNATIAKRALTSFMSYGALNKGFWFAIDKKILDITKSYKPNTKHKDQDNFLNRINLYLQKIFLKVRFMRLSYSYIILNI